MLFWSLVILLQVVFFKLVWLLCQFLQFLSLLEHVVKQGVLKELLKLLSHDRAVSLEHVARTVHLLMDLHEGCLAECQKAKDQVIPAVRRHLRILKAFGEDHLQVCIPVSGISNCP